jgi:uncharacterized protein YciU (UPF0263 family)
MVVAIRVAACVIFDLGNHRVDDVLRVQCQVHGRGECDVVEPFDDVLKRIDVDVQIIKLVARVFGKVSAPPAEAPEIMVARGNQAAPAADAVVLPANWLPSIRPAPFNWPSHTESFGERAWIR